MYSQSNTQRDRFLLLDSRVVESTENAKLTVGTVEKHESNPLFGEDKPWEKRYDNLYGNMIYDREEELYKCWYSPFIVDLSARGMSFEERKSHYLIPKDREMGICYATSIDGITWQKPNLGLVDFEGNKDNNIIWRGPHGVGIFKDHSDPGPARRYKSIYYGLLVSVSADGIHWGEPIDCEGVNVAGDTHNNAFFAPTLGKYVGITRTWEKSIGRQVARIESEDFVHWTKEEVVMEGVNKNLQPYAMPVFFHAGVYLGLVAIHDQSADRVWTELAWSPDTKRWHRLSPGTPFIPVSEEEMDYDWGCVYAAANPVFLKDEIRLYYGGSDGLHFGWRNGFLCLASLRPDGFAGYEQEFSDRPAMITTAPIDYAGQTIQITADVEKGGAVKVIVIDAEGKHISEVEIDTTVTDSPLQLNMNIKADKIQLKFELSKAKLYAFSFGD
jgi:hypothetical protein